MPQKKPSKEFPSLYLKIHDLFYRKEKTPI